MKCPRCKSSKYIEIDFYVDGFAADARECGECRAVWTFSRNERKIVDQSTIRKPMTFPDFICPTCKSILCIETDLDAFQFHEEIQECANCGTVCSSVHDQVEVVKDSQENSFLSTTSDLVESDDYVFM